MRRLRQYLERVKTLVEQRPFVFSLTIAEERIEEDAAYYRYRVLLANNSFLEMSDRFELARRGLTFLKYSFHWQDSRRQIIARWDDAPHHPQLSTFPHHVHDGSEENVLEHEAVTAADVLRLIEERLQST